MLDFFFVAFYYENHTDVDQFGCYVVSPGVVWFLTLCQSQCVGCCRQSKALLLQTVFTLIGHGAAIKSLLALTNARRFGEHMVTLEVSK